MNIPYGVSTCLYHGISTKIEWLQRDIERCREHGGNKVTYTLMENSYNEIKGALEFYLEHCIVSGAYLQERFDKMSEEYKALKSASSS